MTQKKIVISLYSEDIHHPAWVLIDENGQITQKSAEGNLQDLSELAKEADVVVIVPGSEVLLTTVKLPKLKKHNLRQAVPFAIEDQLIDDVSNLHFALGEYQTDGTLPVVIVAKEKMQNWIDPLKQAHILPSIMVPDILAVPYDENHWQTFSYGGNEIVRTGKYTGFTAEKTNLDQLLEFQRGNSSEPIEIVDYGKITLEKIADNLPNVPIINLLQKPYFSKRKKSLFKNVWKYAAYAAVAWIGLAFLGNLISLIILSHENNQINNKIAAIYKHHFPNATTITAPRERMTTKLKDVSKVAQKNNFLSLLASVGQAFSQSSGVRILNLDFRNGQLTLEVSAPMFDNLDVFSSDLNKAGLSVTQQNAASTGSQVKATLLINAGAA